MHSEGDRAAPVHYSPVGWECSREESPRVVLAKMFTLFHYFPKGISKSMYYVAIKFFYLIYFINKYSIYMV